MGRPISEPAAAAPAHAHVRVTMDQHFVDGSWATSDEVAVAAGPRAIMHLLRDMDGYGGWWPGMHVRLAVHTPVGVGSEGAMAIGPLRRPAWRFRVNEIRDPEFIQLEFRGGLSGRAAWELEPHGALTAVRFATATPSSGGGLTASLGFLRSGRSAVQTGTVTTGVRGLSETDLANSVPDPAAVDALDALVVGTEDAQQHARSLGLKATEVKFIKPPDKEKDGKGKKSKDDDDEDGG